MKIKRYHSRQEWLDDRPTRITGTKLEGVYSPKLASKTYLQKVLDAEETPYKASASVAELEQLLSPEAKQVIFLSAPKKKGFYQLIADRVALPADPDEDPMERGNRLEKEAVAALSKECGEEFITDLVMWFSDEDERIAYSPDAYRKDLKVAVEVKCLDAANHVQAIIEKRVPDEHRKQMLQAFVVNPELELLYFTFYNPLIAAYPLFALPVRREDVQEEIAQMLEYEKSVLDLVNFWVERLVF